MRTAPAVIEDRKREALLLLAQRPDGVTVQELSVHLGLKIKTLRYMAGQMVADGSMVSVGHTHTHCYCAPQFVERARQWVENTRREKRRAAWRRRDAKLREDADDESGPQVKQRRISAAKAKPLPKLGAASVFELGAKL